MKRKKEQKVYQWISLSRVGQRVEKASGDSVIREIKEETWIRYFEPQPCGLRTGYRDDEERDTLFYRDKTNKFLGNT